MICDILEKWQQKLILLAGVIHTSNSICFLLGSLAVLLCYTQYFAAGALMHLWGVAGSSVSFLDTHCIRIYIISADLFTESWVNAFQEYEVNCQQAGKLWGFYLFI